MVINRLFTICRNKLRRAGMNPPWPDLSDPCQVCEGVQITVKYENGKRRVLCPECGTEHK